MAVFGLLSLQVLVPRLFAKVCHNINMQWGVKENHVAVIALHNCGKSYSLIYKMFKILIISLCSSIRQLNIMMNSGGLKTGPS